jgi:hypothetical protein
MSCASANAVVQRSGSFARSHSPWAMVHRSPMVARGGSGKRVKSTPRIRGTLEGHPSGPDLLPSCLTTLVHAQILVRASSASHGRARRGERAVEPFAGAYYIYKPRRHCTSAAAEMVPGRNPSGEQYSTFARFPIRAVVTLASISGTRKLRPEAARLPFLSIGLRVDHSITGV